MQRLQDGCALLQGRRFTSHCKQGTGRCLAAFTSVTSICLSEGSSLHTVVLVGSANASQTLLRAVDAGDTVSDSLRSTGGGVPDLTACSGMIELMLPSDSGSM